MVEERESKEKTKMGSITAPTPIKRVINNGGNKSQSLAETRYPVRIRTPSLTDCHVCGSQINSNRNKIQTLDSQWRIVIICNSCLKNVKTARVCSYCFKEKEDVSISCRVCSCSVHKECVLMFGRLNMYPNLDSFRCIDCWIPRTLKKVVRKRKRSSSSSSSSNVDWDSSSLDTPRVETEGNPKSIEDKVKDAKSNAEMKVANAAKVREEALKKAAMARKAAQKAANALDVAVAANGEVQGDGSCCPVVDDAELALRLHRAINSSPRIFRNMRSVKLENLVDPKEVKLNASSLSRQSDPEKRVLNGELKVCTGNIGKAASGRKSSESVSDIGPVKKSDHADCNIENPTKEEQASCSSKVAVSSENGNSTDSGSQSCQKQEGSKLNSRETPCQSVYDKDSSEQEGKSPHGPDICLKMYSRRHKISKCILDQKNNLLPRNCHLESQTSGTALPLTQMEAELTFNDTSLDSHCVPSRASTPASSLA